MRSMIDYASGLDESGVRSERDRKLADRLARIEVLEQRMRSANVSADFTGVLKTIAAKTEREILASEIAREQKEREEMQAEPPMPAEQEILPENLTQEQCAHIRASIATITDLDASVIEACNYSPAELVTTFNQATEYHNKIANGFNDLEKVRTRNTFRAGGQYASTETIYDYGAEAVKIQAKLDFYNHSLTRLAQGITTRAVLQTVKGLRP